MMRRRGFLEQAGILAAGTFLAPHVLKAAGKNKPTILLVSGWQDVNIGDIAHTPGLLNVLETYVPEAKIILWKRSKGEEVAALLQQNFPEVRIIYGDVDKEHNVESPAVKAAFREADIMLHGSGPSIVGAANLEAWHKSTGKPFGIFGVTIQTISPALETLLKKAAFIYTRETKSLQVLEKAGISGPQMSFAPDATFFLDIHNEKAAVRFLKEQGLEEKKFICAIPRLRYTPYHKIRQVNWSEERIKKVETVNALKKEADHAKLREAMIAWVRETGNKVLVCPEMTYQVDIMNELLIDPLPEDVKPSVVTRGYWMPDEAASVYARAHTVLSFECHSPIIAAANSTPFFYLRQPEDTIKGQMYYDLGFDDWIFEIEQTEGEQIAARLREVWTGYEEANEKLAVSMRRVGKIYEEASSKVREMLG
ncbi:MAG TPA: polysaccharide pyruvyl transferase family protein [Anseongella sp.]|nr:polysaccharide pyruvyl transferase family protein [Anseongella sp.]